MKSYKEVSVHGFGLGTLGLEVGRQDLSATRDPKLRKSKLTLVLMIDLESSCSGNVDNYNPNHQPYIHV